MEVYKLLEEKFNKDHNLQDPVNIQLVISEEPVACASIDGPNLEIQIGKNHDAEFVLKLNFDSDLQDLIEGKKTGMESFMDGSLQIEGDIIRLSGILKDAFDMM